MRVYRGFDDIPRFEEGAVATVGSFDGVHSGHAMLLSELRKIADRDSIPSVVLTFEPHPRVVLGRTDGLKLLTSLEEKIMILENIGVDYLIVIHFDREFSRLSYEDFISKYLIEKIGVSTIVVGYNHHIGRNSEGSYSSLMSLSQKIGFEVRQINEWRPSTERDSDKSISSTVIRRMLLNGEIAAASTFLDRPYLICGRADARGRVWYDEPLKLIPAEGKYRVKINGLEAWIEIDNNSVVTSKVVNDNVVIEMQNDVE